MQKASLDRRAFYLSCIKNVLACKDKGMFHVCNFRGKQLSRWWIFFNSIFRSNQNWLYFYSDSKVPQPCQNKLLSLNYLRFILFLKSLYVLYWSWQKRSISRFFTIKGWLFIKKKGWLFINKLPLDPGKKYYDLKTTPFTSSKNLIKVNGPLAYTAHRHFFFIQWTFKMLLSEKSQIIFKIFLSLWKFFQRKGISGVSTKSGSWQPEDSSFTFVSTISQM